MDFRKAAAGVLAFSMLAAMAGCSDSKDTSESKADGSSAVSEQPTEAAPVEATEAEQPTEELIPPSPVEASDPNTVTFDDGDFSFAEIIERNDTDNADTASGELSVVDIQGNKMLRFSDDNSIPLSGKVQKIKISAVKLIGAENLDKVKKIEFDVYAIATASNLKTDEADNVKAPGWVGGGGGTVCDGDKWYDFSEFSGGEYFFEMSGAAHGEFKFVLSKAGMKWTNEMEDANFLIMRWGVANESDLLIDNIVFYDEEGYSIPLAKES